MSQFTHLHVHTQYSLLDGAAAIKKLMKKAQDDGMTSIAITDHGNLYGVMEFFLEAKKFNLKPIIGCEMYVARTSHLNKDSRSGYHLVLLAKNKIGYHNLARLSSIAFTEGFYYTPRIDKELLNTYKEGLIACSACLGGEIPNLILNNNIEKARQALEEYLEIFKNDFYLELQRHGRPEQDLVNKELIKLAKEYNVKLIATNDVHYVDKEDFNAHNILINLNTNDDGENAEKLRYTGFEYFRTSDEMSTLFSDIPESITATMEIADKIEDYDITTKQILLPKYPIPEPFEGENEYLSYLTFEGAKKRYPQMDTSTEQRLNMELEVIKNMGFPGYFLIVQDFINEARTRGVWVGPGRGSAAGSAVAYCIGITDIDPIKYNLLFERFLNPERISMPDIDIDFDDENRDLVLEYVIEKYGSERVAQIVTFGTMASRSAIRDVARIKKLPLPEADRLSKLVPENAKSLNEAYNTVPELKEALNGNDENVVKVLKLAQTLEGSVRNTGVHACGVIIGPEDLKNHVPLARAKDAKLFVTQYEGKYVESVGMLKMDFLGLKTLTILRDTLENIKLNGLAVPDLDNLDLEDKKTYELFQRGDSIAIFQFESDGMRAYMKELKPTNIEDLIALNALYRPGPMDQIPTYIKRKHGKEKIEYAHELIEEILKPTYGIMVYQEQIMQAAQLMAGYSLGKADILRRAMGKKKPEEMEKQRKVFIEGAQTKGIEQKKAEEVFNVMEKFAEYGFNRSHAAAYALLAYKSAYLKAHFPSHFMAAVLTHNLNDIKKITSFMEECRRSGLKVLGPDVNESFYHFSVNSKGEIRFGLGAVKGVGEGAVETIVQERDKNGKFTSFFDLLKRINLRLANKKAIEALAMSGAFDSLHNINRSAYFFTDNNSNETFIDKAIKHVNNIQLRQNTQQASLFGDAEELQISDPAFPICEPWDINVKLQKEREIIGFFVSGHPLDTYKHEMKHFCHSTIAEVKATESYKKDKEFTFGGIITEVAHKLTKTGKPMGVFTMEDFTDNKEFFLFSDKYIQYKNFLEKNYHIYVKAKVDSRYNSPNQLELTITHMELLSDIMDKLAKQIIIRLNLNDITDDIVNQLSNVIAKCKGNCPLKVNITDTIEKYYVEMPSKKHFVDPHKILDELQRLHIDFSLK